MIQRVLVFVGIITSGILVWTLSTHWISAAGIAFDATTSFSGDGSVISRDFTVTGNDALLLCGLRESDGVDSVTGVTYDGVAMTLLNKLEGHAGRKSYLYALVAPHEGTHALAVSNSDSNEIQATCISYVGADQTSQPDATSFGTGLGSPATRDISTASSGAWIALFASNPDGNWHSPVNAKARGQAFSAQWFDSDGPVSPDIMYAMSLPYSGDGRRWTWQQVSIKPAVSSGSSFLKDHVREIAALATIGLLVVLIAFLKKRYGLRIGIVRKDTNA